MKLLLSHHDEIYFKEWMDAHVKKLVVTGLIDTAATQVYAHDTQAAEKDAADASKVMLKDEAIKDMMPIIHKPTYIYPHLEGEDDAAYLKRMATNPPEGAVPYAVLNKDGSITEANTDPHFDILKIEDSGQMKAPVNSPVDEQDAVPTDLQIEPPALIGPAAKQMDAAGDAKSHDDHKATKSSKASAQDMKKKDMAAPTAQSKADKQMAAAKVVPAKQQDKAVKMLPAAGEPQVNAIAQTALAFSMIALGVIAFFTRRRKINE